MDEFVKDVERTIISEGLLEAGSRVVIGISGGPDSVALTGALLELRPTWGFELILAHLNHGLRGAESDRDEQWVRDFASRLGLPFHSEKLSNPPTSNLEQGAREERYDFLVRTAHSCEAAYLAVGHHADDVAETLLLNLLRGAGLGGVSSLSPCREAGPDFSIKIVRPLFRAVRSDVMGFLERQGLAWREDTSNRDPGFARNRIRHEVLPVLADMNPAVSRVLARSADVLRKEYEALHSIAGDWLSQNARSRDGSVVLSLEELPSGEGLCLAVLRESIRSVKGDLRSVSATHLAELLELLKKRRAGSSLDLPGVRVFVEKDRVVVERVDKSDSGIARKYQSGVEEAPGVRLLEVPGSVDWRGPGGRLYRVCAQMIEKDDKEPWAPECRAYLNAERIKGRLQVRGIRQGDRYFPAGRKHRKLYKFMNELKVPARHREFWPVVEDKEGLVWVPGLAPAARAFAGNGGLLLKLEVRPCLFEKGQTGGKDYHQDSGT
ncbi:MAG: tRNA lysidine(34) synthetase TilS [bacterium]